MTETLQQRWAMESGFGTPPKTEGRKDFNPHQPRDPHTGEWTDVPGGGAASAAFKTTADAAMDDTFKGRNPVASGSNPFTEADIKSVEHYVGSQHSFDINKVLRGPLGIDSSSARLFAGVIDDVHGIDAAMDHSGKLGKPVKVVRVTKSDPEAIVAGDNPADPASVAGHSYVEKGFGSTTTNPDWADEFADPSQPGTEWQLTVSPDVKAIWGANPTERELLLQRNLRYTIHGVRLRDPKQSGPKWIVDASVEPA